MFAQHARISRRAAGTSNDEGIYTPGAETVVYDAAVDAQDVGEVLSRDNTGTPTATSDVTLFLADESKLVDIKRNDVVTITWENQITRDARVARVRIIDGAVLCDFV
jgi:hypothetical protein